MMLQRQGLWCRPRSTKHKVDVEPTNHWEIIQRNVRTLRIPIRYCLGKISQLRYKHKNKSISFTNQEVPILPGVFQTLLVTQFCFGCEGSAQEQGTFGLLYRWWMTTHMLTASTWGNIWHVSVREGGGPTVSVCEPEGYCEVIQIKEHHLCKAIPQQTSCEGLQQGRWKAAVTAVFQTVWVRKRYMVCLCLQVVTHYWYWHWQKRLLWKAGTRCTSGGME